VVDLAVRGEDERVASRDEVRLLALRRSGLGLEVVEADRQLVGLAADAKRQQPLVLAPIGARVLLEATPEAAPDARVVVANQMVRDARRSDRAEEARVDDALEALGAVRVGGDGVDVLRSVADQGEVGAGRELGERARRSRPRLGVDVLALVPVARD